MPEKTLRRGKPEERSHFERAKDAFTDAKGDTRVIERVDSAPGCPTCGAPMRLVHSYKGKESYHFEGICSSDTAHNLERYGYFSTEGGE